MEKLIYKTKQQMGAAAAVHAAEAIRQAIEESSFALRREVTKITISIGVVSFPQDALDSGELTRQADTALYKAKSEGRNRVCTI